MSRPATALLAVAALFAAACGSAPGAASTPSPSPSPSLSAGPPQTFAIQGVNGSKATGKILLTPGSETFVLEVRLTGLDPLSSHISHIHAGDCLHPGPVKFALQQVTADGTGAADTRTQVPGMFPPASGHWYVVVHAGPDMQGPNSAYLMCGNLF